MKIYLNYLIIQNFIQPFFILRRQQQQDVGPKGVITGCDAFSLRSSIADLQGVAQTSLQSTYLYSIRFEKYHPFGDEKLREL